MRIERIVAGTDFSEPSVAAARWVARQFAPTAELVLVYSVEVPEPPHFLSGLVPPHDELVETLRTGGAQRLEELRRSLGGDHIRVEVRVGRPADVLSAEAEKIGADLLVVGEHGRHRGIGGILGSTAEQLVRRSPVPVLLARGLPEGPPRILLLPVDASDVSDDVLAWGVFLRDRFGADTIGLHAVSPMLYGRISVISSVPRAEELEKRMLANARDWLAGRMRAAGLPAEGGNLSVSFGDPGHEIDAAVQRFDVDLVVMGSRGAGAAGRLLLGSTAGTVLRGAACPVLVLHEPKRRAKD